MPLVPGAPDLAETTLLLVDVPSESRAEAPAVDLVRELMPGTAAYDDGEVLLYGSGPIVLAGHLDTIPAQGNFPGRLEGGAVHGVGASDMKAGIAVMVELARAGVPGRYLFFTREEVPVSESPLPALFATDRLERRRARRRARADRLHPPRRLPREHPGADHVRRARARTPRARGRA